MIGIVFRRGFLLLLLCFTVPALAQFKKAQSYFENNAYAQAAPLYEKGLKGRTDTAAETRLAFCYKFLKDYPKAEFWYAQLAQAPGINPLIYFYYGQVLKSSNKPDSARQQFERYLLLVPTDKVARTELEACLDISSWLKEAPRYSVKNVTGLNSPNSDFSPVYYKEGIVFTSDRGNKTDLLADKEDPAGSRIYSTYYGTYIKKTNDTLSFASPKAFAAKLNDDMQSGPVSFTRDQQLMAFNRVDKQGMSFGKAFTNRPKIYFASWNGKEFTNPVPFPYNSDNYTVAHPSLSPDGLCLYFSSDMPGGYGGKDIYVSYRQGDSWTKPENLGSYVNTAGDELFPAIQNDHSLFFASDGHPGFGGLDLYSASKVNGKWGNITNLGFPLNGPADDFGMVFSEGGNEGYFSSDRTGGMGGDDIYRFQTIRKTLRIVAKIVFNLNGSDPARNAKLKLLSAEGVVVGASQTDAGGFFKFENLAPDKKYSLQLDENDPAFDGKSKAWLTDEKGKAYRVTLLHNKAKGPHFQFTDLPPDPSGIAEIYAADDLINLAATLLTGNDPATPMADRALVLKNEKGEIIQRTITNSFGAFAFIHLPPGESYVVSLDEGETHLAVNTRVSITNRNGKVIAVTMADGKGTFYYRIISTDKTVLAPLQVADGDLRVDLKGYLHAGDASHRVLKQATLRIKNEKGETLRTVRTDDKGYFQFINLPSDQNYTVSVEEENNPGGIKLQKVLWTDASGKVQKEIPLNKSGKFDFQLLPAEQSALGTVYEDDPWLEVLQLKEEKDKKSNSSQAISIIENIYYPFGDWNVLPEAENILSKVIQVMKNDPDLVVEIDSHTDSRASAEFNMALSNRRAKATADYIIARGIPASRIIGIGFGETHLLNKCADGVECSDEEHAINRRTEFKITRRDQSQK